MSLGSAEQFEEWREVGQRFDELLPKMLELYGDPNDPTKNGDVGLVAIAGLKAAIHASYVVGQSQIGDYLKISNADDSLSVRLHNGILTPSELYDRSNEVTLNGSVSGEIVQALGSLVGDSSVLNSETSFWYIEALSSGETAPYVRVNFKRRSDMRSLFLTAGFADIGSISAQMPPTLTGGEGAVDTQRSMILTGREPQLTENINTELITNAVALTNALTEWITRPEHALRSRSETG